MQFCVTFCIQLTGYDHTITSFCLSALTCRNGRVCSMQPLHDIMGHSTRTCWMYHMPIFGFLCDMPVNPPVLLGISIWNDLSRSRSPRVMLANAHRSMQGREMGIATRGQHTGNTGRTRRSMEGEMFWPGMECHPQEETRQTGATTVFWSGEILARRINHPRKTPETKILTQ